jgi:hypothetical protein
MSTLGDGLGVLDRISLASTQQRVCRLVVLATTVLFLVLVPASGGVFHPVLTTATLLLALLVALLPESNAALGLVLALGLLWLLSTVAALDLWTLAAAVDLWALHLACTLASYGPPGLRLDRSLLTLWWRRFWVGIGAALMVWLAGALLELLDLPASGLALALALLAFLGWVTLLTTRLAAARDD